MRLGHLAGRRRSLGGQLLDHVQVPGGLVAIDFCFGDVAGKGELLLLRATTLHRLVPGFGAPQCRNGRCQFGSRVAIIQGHHQLPCAYLIAQVDEYVLDDRRFGSVRLENMFRLDPAIGAVGLDQVLHLSLGHA